MLSFDEFQAINKRNRNQKTAQLNNQNNDKNNQNNNTNTSKQPQTQTKLINKEENENNKNNNNLFELLGQFLERNEIQIIIIILIIFDSFITLLNYILLSNNNNNIFIIFDNKQYIEIIYKLIYSFNLFSLIFFIIEIILLLISFQFQLLLHLGYLIDIIIVGIELYENIYYNNTNTRILNIFRLWRLVRLFQSLVNYERDLHNETLKVLEAVQLKKQLVDEKVLTLTDELRKEQVS